MIQITAGRGPVECCRVVAKLQELLLQQAQRAGINMVVMENKKAHLKGALLSATLLAEGKNLDAFAKEWQGTVQWIATSPYRTMHKRKNWFAGIAIFDLQQQLQWNEKEINFETCRASGPGGQNVNKVETAVRGTHQPSGIQVLAMDTRSQWQNKKLCTERLKAKVMAWQAAQLNAQQQQQWQMHNVLERGNAIKTITANLL